jgi:hypothetical protein
VNPYEVYTTYLALKRHFSSEQYDFFKYQGKIRCSLESFKKCKDRFFFEKISRKKNSQEVIDFFVSNFIASDSPSSLWIGDIIKHGETIYNEHKRIKESLSYLFEQNLKTLTESQHLYDLVKTEGTKHPKLLKLHLNGTVRFEIFFVFIECLNIKERYDQSLEDPIWKLTSTKISKYENFFTGDLAKYKSIIKKYIT